MKTALLLLIVIAASSLSSPDLQSRNEGSQPPRPSTATASRRSVVPEGVTPKDAAFYSEGIRCYGKIFLPPGFSSDSKVPGVVLAPAAGETAASIEGYAARLAQKGLIAMAIDYRGWGKSGAYLQTVDEVKTDDRLRFSQMTTRVRFQRKRLIPQQQVLDIRNALYYLQGEPGVDRARVGVWGIDLAGGHVVVIAATDSRVKAVVAQAPILDGTDKAKTASAPTGELLLAEQGRARTGQLTSGTTAAAATKQLDLEARLALSEYHPFWYLDQIPEKTAVLFVIGDKDDKVNNETHSIAASKILKGPNQVITVQGLNHKQIDQGTAFDAAVNAAADWFLKHL